MSNEILSPSLPATGFTRGLASKLFDIGEFGLIKSPAFQGVLTSELDAFVKEAGPELRNAFVNMVERRFLAFNQTLTGCYRVSVNYSKPNAIAAAIEANEFAFSGIYVDLPKIPLIGSGEVVEQVYVVRFASSRKNRSLPAALKVEGQKLGFKLGFKFANPLTALRFALIYPDKQLEYPHAILFTDSQGQLCYIGLRDHEGGRYLYISNDYDEDEKLGYFRFLAVPELGPVAE